MAKRGPLIFFGLVVLVGALLFMRPYVTHKREAVTSTPVAPALYTSGLQKLPPKHEACNTGVTFETATRYARFPVQTYNLPGPLLRIRTAAPGYRYATQVKPGYRDGSVDIALQAPKHETKGLFCIRNDGTHAVALSTTGVGWTIARSTTLLDGVQQTQYVPLTLHEASPHTPVNRLPKTLQHAATLWSLPLGLFWALVVLALVLVPLGTLWALRASVLAGDAAAAGSPAIPPAPPLPLGRWSAPLRRASSRAWARLSAIPAWLAITGLTFLTWAYVYMWASRVHTFQTDEHQIVYLARLTKHFMPQALTDTTYFSRGIQRLEIFLLAAPLAVMQGPDALLVGRAINTLAYASAAIPIFLVTRGLGASRGWSLLAAALAVLTPWAVYATAFLTEPLGYPLCAWTLWAVWRAAVRPGIRADLVVFLVLFLAVISRSGFLVLLVLPVVVFVALELRFTPLRSVPMSLVRKHPLMSAVIAAGGVVLLLSLAGALFPVSRLTGVYGTSFTFAWGVLDKAAERSAPIVIGAAFVPFCFGLAWLLSHLVKPIDERRFAWAVGALATLALLIYGAQSSGFDERYGMYLILPVLPPFALSLAGRRREVGPVAVAAAGIFFAVLIWRQVWATPGNAYDYFVFPAETFYSHVVLQRLGTYMPAFLSVDTAAFILLLGVAAACVYSVARLRSGATAALTLAVLVLLTQLGQTEYSLRHFVEGAGGRASPGVSQRGWVDRVMYGKAQVDILADNQGNGPIFAPIWDDIEFWNTSVTGVVGTSDRQINVPLGDAWRLVNPDPTTGLMKGAPPLKRYFLVPRMYQGTGLAGTLVKESPYLPVDLIRVGSPVYADYTLGGPFSDGFVPPKTTVEMRFYGAGLDRSRSQCASIPLVGAVDLTGAPHTRRYEVELGNQRVTGTLKNGEQKTVSLRLGALRTQPFTTGTIKTSGTIKIADGRQVTLQLGRLGVAPCTTA